MSHTLDILLDLGGDLYFKTLTFVSLSIYVKVILTNVTE